MGFLEALGLGLFGVCVVAAIVLAAAGVCWIAVKLADLWWDWLFPVVFLLGTGALAGIIIYLIQYLPRRP